MRIVEQAHEAIREAMRANDAGVKLAALMLTEGQRFELVRDAPPCNWFIVGSVEKYGGLVVITVPEGIFYTPRILMGDR